VNGSVKSSLLKRDSGRTRYIINYNERAGEEVDEAELKRIRGNFEQNPHDTAPPNILNLSDEVRIQDRIPDMSPAPSPPPISERGQLMPCGACGKNT